MSRLSDYRNRMTLSQFADEEIEQLISHQIATDPQLAALAGFLTDLRGENLTPPSPTEVERLARSAASVVRSLPDPVRSAPRRQRNLLTVLRTYSATAVSLLALVVFFGLGLTANASVPGDLLYGLDLALERVGIGAGALPERISEGQVLADRGEYIEAADHLKVSISNFGDQATAEDLMRAMEALDVYEGIVDGVETPDDTPPPTNENTGPGNNNAGGNNETNENTGPGNNNAGGNNETNENAGPGNNNAGGNNETNENAGPGNNNAGGNNKTNENTGPGNNNAGGNNETNENAGPGNNNAGGNSKAGK